MEVDLANSRLLIVGIGGTFAPMSSTEQALRSVLGKIENVGASTVCFGSAELTDLPHYQPGQCGEVARKLLSAVRQADGIVLASPGYHGSVSGLMKNAIDYLEETARDDRPYFDGLPVGAIATAHGWQAAVSALASLRTMVHALRGWPTPLGMSINSSVTKFAAGGTSDTGVDASLSRMATQVFDFALRASSISTAVGNSAEGIPLRKTQQVAG